MSHPTPATAQPSPSSQQPQRIAKACLACRNRKQRCDGERPACRACRKRGIGNSCNYEWMNRRHLRQISRDGNIEGVERSAGQHFSEPSPTAPEGNLGGHSTAHDVPDSDGIPAFAGSNDSTSYGSASMVAFYRHIASPGAPSNTRQPPVVTTNIPSATTLLSSRTMALLPRRSSADEFVYCFFEHFQPIFPVVNRPDFERQYERLWTPLRQNEDESMTTDQDEAAFAATLNLVFAIGSRISSSVEPQEKRIVPEEFYQRARDLYRYDLLSSSSFAVLQMLLLIALYLQATQRAAECWNSLGLTIRVAQSLGLHADRDKECTNSPKQMQLRRQIWHLCVQLDR